MPTQADLDALDQAIADGKGARTITFSDQSITFESIDDMLKRRSFLARLLSSTSSSRPTTRLAATSKGV